MQSFIALYGFLEIVLRAALLAAQAMVVGGVAFLALVISPLGASLGGDEAPIARRCLRLLYWSCLASAVGEFVAGGVLIAMLVGTLRVDVSMAASANAVVAHFAAALVAGALALIVRRGVGDFVKWRGIVVGLALLLVCAHMGVTHAASRPDAATLLVATEIVHILAASIWLGGIPYFIAALALARDGASRRLVGSRFSKIAVCAVAALVAGGVLLMTRYTPSLDALYETNYGVLMSNKIVLLIGLLGFAAANFLTVRKLWRVPSTPIKTLSRFAEVEIGLGLVALFCAAALASTSPAIDAGTERTSFAEISARFAPRWPSFESPAYAQLSAARKAADGSGAESSNVAEPAAPAAAARNAADIAWAEINHHLAGVLVVLMGVFALLEHDRRGAPVMRNWPLLFLLLAGVLVVRADEGAWPLGALGFFESLRNPQIAQHKLIVLLIAAFAIFEWRVRRNTFKAAWPAYVFPLTIGAAAAFLLTHYGHTDGKDEVLIAISHTPVALLGIAAASGRWLELRLPDTPAGRAGGFVWPTAFLLSGVLLLLYREA